MIDSYTLFPVDLILWNCSLFQTISHTEFMGCGLKVFYEVLT